MSAAPRAYFVDGMPASEVADRFGYSTASVHQMATLLRGGKLSLFTDPRPGPKAPRKATGELRGQGPDRRLRRRHGNYRPFRKSSDRAA